MFPEARYTINVNSYLASVRREEREAQKRQRELERRAKDQAKLSAIEQSRLEVETHENQLEVLLSIHKHQGEIWDWAAVATTLPPPCPQKSAYYEFRAKQQMTVRPPYQREGMEIVVERARLQDERVFQDAMVNYTKVKTDWEKTNSLSHRILAGEHKAYLEALVELSPLSEISDLGSSLHFTVHSPKLLECRLKSNGRQAIPSEDKALTAAGKLSVKTMPKGRFQAIYQDYICACVLRVAREIFALLPIETLLVTASADELDTRTGQTVEQPVLSAAISHADVAHLDFKRLDPSDAMDNFLHRGDFKESRKSGAFKTITPLTPGDLPLPSTEKMDFHDVFVRVQRMRAEIQTQLTEFCSQPAIAAPQKSTFL